MSSCVKDKMLTKRRLFLSNLELSNPIQSSKRIYIAASVMNSELSPLTFCSNSKILSLQDVGSILFTLTATDLDIGDNGRIEYSIVSHNSSTGGMFHLINHNGSFIANGK